MIQGCYLAYPIDQRGPAHLTMLFEGVERLKREMVGRGLIGWTFDPGDAFKVSKDAMLDDTLPRINRAALNNADLVVAWMPAGVASIGVPMEIDRAVSQGKHVIVFSEADSWMLQYPHGRVTRIMSISMDDAMVEHICGLVANLEPVPQERDQEPLLVASVEESMEPRLPTRQYGDDAGLDLYTSAVTEVPPGSFRDIPCGVRAALPPWALGIVTGRSSALRKKGLLVHTGIIDAGYRGPLFAGAWNMTDEPVVVELGERIAQLLILNNATRYVQPVAAMGLPDSERGTRGFGSSGS